MSKLALFVSLAICITYVLADDEVTELKSETLFKPSGEECEKKKSKRLDMLTMHYTGKLTDGTQFDSSQDHGQPFQFQLGIGQVIKGWDEGLKDMCVGEKRKLTVPSHMAYGEEGSGEKIPPKSTLVFEVELMGIEDGPKPENIFKKIDKDKDNALTRDEIADYLQIEFKHMAEKDQKTEEPDGIIKNIFSHEDKDGDGVISFEEFSGPKHDEL